MPNDTQNPDGPWRGAVLRGLFWQRTDCSRQSGLFAHELRLHQFGRYTAGSLFEWDRAGNKLTFLGNVPGFDTPDNPDNKNILAEYQGGVELGGEFEQFASVSADAAIRRRSAFEIENGNRVPFNNVYSRLTGFLADDARAGGSVMQEWGMTEAIDDPDTLYVIIRDVTYGDKINLLVEGEAKVGGAFSVPLQGDKSFEIKIEGRGLEEIKGDNVAVSFFVYVLEPYWLQGEDAQTFAGSSALT
jgi:hypothetical protein